MTKTKEQTYAEAVAALTDFDRWREVEKTMRGHADKYRERPNSKDDLPKFDLWLHDLNKMLPSVCSIVRQFNDHPGLEYYGIEPLDSSMSPTDLLAEVHRRLRENDAAISSLELTAKPKPRADRRLLELKLMDILIAAGKSRNEAAKMVLAKSAKPRRSISPLLKRYRNYVAKKGVAKPIRT